MKKMTIPGYLLMIFLFVIIGIFVIIPAEKFQIEEVCNNTPIENNSDIQGLILNCSIP